MREQSSSKSKPLAKAKTKTAMDWYKFRPSKNVEDRRDDPGSKKYYKGLRDDLDKDLAKEFSKDKPREKKGKSK